MARHYPDAIISNITALVIHGLSDERIDRIDVDISRNSSIRNKLICVHRVSKPNLIGAVGLNYHGEKIRVYCKERTLAEAYRIDPEGPLFLKAVKRFIKGGKINFARIVKYDKLLSTEVLRAVRQELADE